MQDALGEGREAKLSFFKLSYFTLAPFTRSFLGVGSNNK
jgi:hypothetical protein